MEILSLSELGKFIKQVIALNFVDSMWISCEISQISTSRGHCYLNLVEKDKSTDDVIAFMSAAIWFKDFQFIKKKLGLVADKILQDGMEVKLKVELDYHERYGLKLLVKDIDPSYTFGQLAINREQVIQRLKEENRIKLNSSIPFPTVVQKIAVISSHTAAGYQDLTNQLENNQYNYAFNVELFPAAMQGHRTEMEVIAQLREIKKTNSFQVVIITRGGGSKLDLASFDSYEIAKEISEMNIPVITGIGHEIDSSIADLVSSVSLKTPTAVANFLIDQNAAFETGVYNAFVNIKFETENKIKKKKIYLEQFIDNLKSNTSYLLLSKKNTLENTKEIIRIQSKNKLNRIQQKLNSIQSIIEISDPKQILKKGYSIATLNGKTIKSQKDVKSNDIIDLTFFDGRIKTKVE